MQCKCSSSKMAEQKRNRSSNWSKSEVSLLKQMVLDNEAVLNHSHCNEVTNKKKRDIWGDITTQINLLGVCSMSLSEVKTKWANESRKLKKDYSIFKKESNKTGGGPPPASQNSEDEQLLSVFSQKASFNGVPGGLEIEPVVAEGSAVDKQTMPVSASTSSVEVITKEYSHYLSDSEPDNDTQCTPDTSIVSTKKIGSTQIQSGKRLHGKATPFRIPKRKIAPEDIYKKQLEVLEAELKNKELENKKLKLQISLLERMEREKDQMSAQEIMNSIMLG